MLLVHEKYQSSFDVAMKCAVECEHCAEACMGNPDMLKCDRICLDYAGICRTISTYMVCGSRFIPKLTKASAEICTACAEECSSLYMERYCSTLNQPQLFHPSTTLTDKSKFIFSFSLTL